MITGRQSAPKGRFATDSLLEGAGFEPSVPREIGHGFETASWRLYDYSLERYRGFADSPLEGDGFEPSVPGRETGESLWLNGNGRCRPRETGGPDNPPSSPRESSYDAFAVVAVRMSALRLRKV